MVIKMKILLRWKGYERSFCSHFSTCNDCNKDLIVGAMKKVGLATLLQFIHCSTWVYDLNYLRGVKFQSIEVVFKMEHIFVIPQLY